MMVGPAPTIPAGWDPLRRPVCVGMSYQSANSKTSLQVGRSPTRVGPALTTTSDLFGSACHRVRVGPPPPTRLVRVGISHHLPNISTQVWRTGLIDSSQHFGDDRTLSDYIQHAEGIHSASSSLKISSQAQQNLRTPSKR